MFVWFVGDVIFKISNHITGACCSKVSKMQKKMRCEPYTLFFCIRLHPLPWKCVPPGCRIKTDASSMMLVGALDCLACNASWRAHDEEMSGRKKLIGYTHTCTWRLQARHDVKHTVCRPGRKVDGGAAFGKRSGGMEEKKIWRENGKREGIKFKWQIGI